MLAEILTFPNRKHNFREILNKLTDEADARLSNILYIISKLHNIRIQQETGLYGLEERYEKRMNELKEEYNRLKEENNVSTRT